MVRFHTVALALALVAGCGVAPVTTKVERQVVKVPVSVKARPSAELLRCGDNLPDVTFYKPTDARYAVALTKDGQLQLVRAGELLTACILGWRAWAVTP